MAILGCLAVLLGACGGGSSGSSSAGGSGTADAAAPDVPPRIDDAPVHGRVHLRDYRGKLTAEAWFSTVEPDAETDLGGTLAWRDGDERCTVASGAPRSIPRADASVPPTLDIGGVVSLSSRAGEYARLEPQRLGDTIVYATAERALAGAPPDDLVLDVPGGPGLAPVVALAVRPLDAPALEAPADGVLDADESAVRWRAADAPQARTRMLLSLSSVAFAGGAAAEGVLSHIRCVVDDDGVFELPSSLRAAPTAASSVPDDGLFVALVRERVTRHPVAGGSLSLVQTSR